MQMCAVREQNKCRITPSDSIYENCKIHMAVLRKRWRCFIRT